MWSVFLAESALGAGPAAGADADTLQEIVVTASLRPLPAAELPASVTVLDSTTLRAAGVQHFEDVLGLIPDLNWAAGTSRPRFFQLRGIGEVEQYQGAPNPSVGFLVDDIDFSGVGMPATLFDTRQIEVLRGPQGTAYGANALAGLISVRTADPGREFELGGELTGATYDTRAAGVVIGDGAASGDWGWRLVAQKFESDGFRHDVFLGRYSTNGFDEGTTRGKLHWRVNDAVTADLTLMHVDIDNGYDGWSIYNNFDTYSNQPGRDAQLSNGAALRVSAVVPGVGEWRSVTSKADSKILYSFDGDWGNDVLWGPYAPYDYFQSDNRIRRTVAEDLRFLAEDSQGPFGALRWLAGAYLLRLTETDSLVYDYNDQYDGAGSSGLDSRYAATNLALYGSLDADIGAATTLSAGLRVERRVARYADTADALTPFPAQVDHMLGGHLSWERKLGPGGHAYATLARGYKGGGFNIGSQILSEQRSFGPESLWNLESGYKYAAPDGRLELQGDVFYTRRQHMQVYLSEQLQQNNPLDYVFYTQNASDGDNAGVEAEAVLIAGVWLGGQWQFTGSGSWLRTRYLGVSGQFAGLGLDGRAQPFAPSYKLAASVEYRHPIGWFARLDASALGSFYYYTSDAQASSAYTLENVRAGYRRGPWTTSLWVRNLFDARYAQQGFFFGLIPPNFPNQAFRQLGDPRQIGITMEFRTGGAATGNP